MWFLGENGYEKYSESLIKNGFDRGTWALIQFYGWN